MSEIRCTICVQAVIAKKEQKAGRVNQLQAQQVGVDGSAWAGSISADLLQGEPALGELLNDPIVQLLMATDGVRHQDLVPILDKIVNAAPSL